MIYVLCFLSIGTVLSCNASHRPRRAVANYARIELGEREKNSNKPHSSLVTYARSEFEENSLFSEGTSKLKAPRQEKEPETMGLNRNKCKKKESETPGQEKIKTKPKKSRNIHQNQEKRWMWVPGFLEEGKRVLESQKNKRYQEWQEKLRKEEERRALEEEDKQYRLASPTAIADRVVHNTQKVHELSLQDQFKRMPHYVIDRCLEQGVLLAEKPMFRGYTAEAMGLYYLYFITHKNNKKFSPQERSLLLSNGFDDWYLKIYTPSLDNVFSKEKEEKRED